MPVGLGIDIGATAFKLVKVQVDGSRVRVLKALRLEHNLSARAGDDFIDLPPTLAQAVQEAGLAGRGTVGVSGQDLMLRYAIVPPAPPWRLDAIMNFEISQGPMADVGEICSAYRILTIPGSSISDQLIVLVAVSKSSTIDQQMAQLAQVRLKGACAVPSSEALFHAWKASDDFTANETVFLMDIGHDRLELVMAQEGEMIFARTMPGGGRKFTQAIRDLLKIDREKADAYKKERAQVSPTAPESNEKRVQAMHRAMIRPAQEIVSAVTNSVRFCQSQAKIKGLKLDRLVISGGGSQMKGLQDYLEAKLKIPVALLKLESTVAPEATDAKTAALLKSTPTDMAVALGLAVTDAQAHAPVLRLIPERIVKQQKFLGRTVYAYAAAAVAALWLVLLVIGGSSDVAQADEKHENYGQKLEELQQKQQEIAAKVQAVNQTELAADLVKRQTVFGVAILEFLRQLRLETPEGISLQKIEPVKDGLTVEGGYRLSISAESRLPPERIAEYVRKLDGQGGSDGKYPYLVGTRNLKRQGANSPKFTFEAILHSGFEDAVEGAEQ